MKILGIQTADGSSYVVGEGKIDSIELGTKGPEAGHFIIRYNDETQMINVVNARFVVSYTAKL
jgi:hypothetical protein